MGNAADEATRIRRLLEQYLPLLVGDTGGEEPMTADEIAAALATLTARLTVPAGVEGGASGQGAVALTGRSNYAAAQLFADGNGSAIEMYAEQGVLLNGDVVGPNNTLRRISNYSLRVPFDDTAQAGFGGQEQWIAVLTPSTTVVYYRMRVQAQGEGLAPARIIWSVFNGGADVDALAADATDSATETGLLVRYNGSLERVRVGAAGSGPGGSGRALYVD